MRPTQVLWRRNIGRMIKFHWYTQGKIKVTPTPSKEILQGYGYDVVDINEFLKPTSVKEKLEVIGLYDKEIPMNEEHPDYKSTPCYIYKDADVLLEGLEQAKVLTNTVEVCDGLPQKIFDDEEKINLSDKVHAEIKKKILLSCLLEATQDKLPKIRDFSRPAVEFRRKYGITDSRKNELLCKNLLFICEQYANNLKNRSVVMNSFFSAPFEAHNKKIQFEVTSELTVTSSKKLGIVAVPSLTHSISLPDLHPIDCTISLKPYHFYSMQNIFPFNMKSKWPFVQTAIVHYNHTQVKNIFGEEVTESQIHGRSLLKGFTIAVSEARALYGNDVESLPEPIIVPVVQTDGQLFHFTIFQLNTLKLDRDSVVKNIFWNFPRLFLYKACEYYKGRPILEEYNPDVIKKLIMFYNME